MAGSGLVAPSKESSSTYYGRLIRQNIAAFGHVFAEGAGKPLGTFTAAAFTCGRNVILPSSNWFYVFLGIFGVQLPFALYNQSNYAARSAYDSLPIDQEKRAEFEKKYPHTDSDYQSSVTSKLRFGLGLLLAFNSLTEVCDSLGAIFALLLGNKDESSLSPTQKGLYILVGLVAGWVQASQSNIVVMRRGWENRAADQAMRRGNLVPSVEHIFPSLETYNHAFAKAMPIVTPFMFGVLHVMAVRKTRLLDGLLPAADENYARIAFFLLGAPLLFMVTMAGTNYYDVLKAGQDLGYEDRLAREYTVSKWLDKKLFGCCQKPVPEVKADAQASLLESGAAVTDEDLSTPLNAASVGSLNGSSYGTSGSVNSTAELSRCEKFTVWAKDCATHPFESVAHLMYGDSLRDGLRHALGAKWAARVLSGTFYVGIFYLFDLALNKNNTEVVETWLGASRAEAWRNAEWYKTPTAIFIAIALLAAVAQTMQKHHAFVAAYKRDEEIERARLAV